MKVEGAMKIPVKGGTEDAALRLLARLLVRAYLAERPADRRRVPQGDHDASVPLR